MNKFRKIAIFAIVASSFLAAASAAPAADATKGDAVVVALGKPGQGLRLKGIKLTAISPATLKGGKLTLPVSDVTLPKFQQGQLVLRGGLKLKAGKKSATIQGFLLTVKSGKISLTAKLGSARIEVLSAPGGTQTKLDAGATSVTVGSAKLKLSKKAAAALRRSLSSRGFRASALGAISGGATAYFPPLVPTPGGPTETPWVAPPFTSRPATAVDVTSAPLTWWIRDSWVNYSVGTAAPQASEGAVPGPAVVDDVGGHRCPSDNPNPDRTNVYAFGLPFKDGWHDSASGTANLNFTGMVRFYYAGRFDVSFGRAELVIKSTGTQMIMTVIDSVYPNGQRNAMFNIDTGAPLFGGPFAVNGPASLLQARLTADGASGAFGGMYGVNLPFGCIDIAYAV